MGEQRIVVGAVKVSGKTSGSGVSIAQDFGARPSLSRKQDVRRDARARVDDESRSSRRRANWHEFR